MIQKMNFTLVTTLVLTFGAIASVFGQSSSGITVSSENGKTTITFHGRPVWRGATKQSVVARTSNINGTEYAAALDGDQVLWENLPGAAANIQQTGKGSSSLTAVGAQSGSTSLSSGGAKMTKGSSRASATAVAGGKNMDLVSGDAVLKTVNGKTTLIWKGKTIDLGRTTGPLSAHASQENGTDYLVVRSGDTIIWENVPGAASHVP